MNFPEKLERLMQDRGLTQLDVATAAGVSTAAVARWLARPGVVPPLQQAAIVARLLGVPLEFLADNQPDDEVMLRIFQAARELGVEEALRRLQAPPPGAGDGDGRGPPS